jgi:rubrerythrin
MSAESKGNTGTADVTYNLVSILFHALQGAETYDQFVRDAEQSGDHDLAQFFRTVKEEDERRANQAKQILGRRLQQDQ